MISVFYIMLLWFMHSVPAGSNIWRPFRFNNWKTNGLLVWMWRLGIIFRCDLVMVFDVTSHHGLLMWRLFLAFSCDVPLHVTLHLDVLARHGFSTHDWCATARAACCDVISLWRQFLEYLPLGWLMKREECPQTAISLTNDEGQAVGGGGTKGRMVAEESYS